jgi:hypothetical protein
MRAPLLTATLLALTVSGCGGPTVDLAQGLEILDVKTGWLDVGIVDGKNKLVPSISFRLKNVSDQPLTVLQINALFRRVSEPEEEWGNAFRTVAGGDGLAPGATTDVIVVSSDLGYTGTDPRLEMLQNKLFVDASVDLLAKYAALQWKLIAKYPIARELITR